MLVKLNDPVYNTDQTTESKLPNFGETAKSLLWPNNLNETILNAESKRLNKQLFIKYCNRNYSSDFGKDNRRALHSYFCVFDKAMMI